ncbi:hypothetical protein GW17_00062072 [Ensete ventricosum]|nr:hypothetical protein GW17_00062072 [Ensete ventricosum]
MNSSTNLEDLAKRVNSGTNLGDLAERVNSSTNLGDLAEKVNSGTNLGDLTERANSGTNLEDLAEGANSGTNLGDLTERANSGTNLGDLAERVNLSTNLEDLTGKANSGTNLGDLAERVNSGTNLGDLVEKVNSGTNLGDLTKKVNSGINLSDLAERANSGTTLCDLAERANSGTSLCDLAERANSDTHLCDLAERANSGINLCDLTERINSGTKLCDLAERANSSTNLCNLAERVNLGANLCDLAERANSGTSLYDLAEGECRGAGIIPTRDLFMACFRFCKSRGGYYLTAHVGFRVSGAPSNNKGWKSRYLFVSGPNWGFRLGWSAHPIGNVPPYPSEEESVLIGRLKGIFSSSCAIKKMTELWLVEAGLSLAFRDRMDLDDLHGMPKVSEGKTPSIHAAVPTREVGVSPAREAPKTSSKRPTDTSTEQIDDLARRHKKVKILSRSHKSRHGEGGSRSHSKGKELAAPVEEPKTLVESAEEDASLVFHRPRSMKDLFKTKVRKDDVGYYALYMSDLAHQDPDKEMQAR